VQPQQVLIGAVVQPLLAPESQAQEDLSEVEVLEQLVVVAVEGLEDTADVAPYLEQLVS
jgi:hypothetical protein